MRSRARPVYADMSSATPVEVTMILSAYGYKRPMEVRCSHRSNGPTPARYIEIVVPELTTTRVGTRASARANSAVRFTRSLSDSMTTGRSRLR